MQILYRYMFYFIIKGMLYLIWWFVVLIYALCLQAMHTRHKRTLRSERGGGARHPSLSAMHTQYTNNQSQAGHPPRGFLSPILWRKSCPAPEIYTFYESTRFGFPALETRSYSTPGLPCVQKKRGWAVWRYNAWAQSEAWRKIKRERRRTCCTSCNNNAQNNDKATQHSLMCSTMPALLTHTIKSKRQTPSRSVVPAWWGWRCRRWQAGIQQQTAINLPYSSEGSFVARGNAVEPVRISHNNIYGVCDILLLSLVGVELRQPYRHVLQY